MAKKVGIYINLSAGTTQFLVDMDKANAKIKDFANAGRQGAVGVGNAYREMGTHGVSGVQAVSGALRVMEGGITNNLRAAERFTANVLGLGPILQAAFPVIGAIAFAGILTKVGEEVVKFYTTMRDAPDKLRGSFGQLNSQLRLTNDQLDETNARIQNDIAKLEGKRQNTLAVALDEARVMADRLADSLDKDLDKLNKVLEENKSTIGQQIFGRISDKGLREELGGKTGFGGFRGDIRQINESGRAEIELAAKDKDQKQVDAAVQRLNSKLAERYAAMLAQIDKQIADATVAQPVYTGKQSVNEMANARARYQNSLPFLEELRYTRSAISEEAASAPKQIQNLKLNQTKTALTASQENPQIDQPFNDRIAQIKAAISAATSKLDAAGLSEASQLIATAEGNAVKAIEEVNKALERRHTALTAAQQADIRSLELKLANTEAEANWQAKLTQSTAEIADQVKSQEMLTDAVGKGYEAVKRASVETQLMSTITPEKYNDPVWMQAHSADVSKLRSQIGREYEARHAAQIAESVDKLNDQITLETRLSQVQSQGAEAVRLATFQARLEKLKQDGASQDQIDKETRLFSIERANAAAADISKINDKIDAVKRLTAAQLQGAEAVRLATLANTIAELKDKTGGASNAAIDAAVKESEAQKKLRISEVIGNRLNLDKKHLDDLEEEKAYLNGIQITEQNRLGIVRAGRDLENERLHVLSEQALSMGGAGDGIRAFFLEMQTQAEMTSRIVYQTLNDAFNGVASSVARLATGSKANFGQMFKSIGEHALDSTIISTMQRGLGAIGKHFGIDTGSFTKKDGSSETAALWVRVAGSSVANAAGKAGGQVLDIAKSAGGMIPSLGKTLGGLFGGGTGLVASFLKSFLIPHASGGDVSPGSGYLVGERGPELLFGASGRILDHTTSMRALSGAGGNFHQYNIDARGADAGAEQRIAMALDRVHRSAITNSVRATSDLGRRMPSPAHA